MIYFKINLLPLFYKDKNILHDVKVNKTDASVEAYLIINFSELSHLIMIVNWKGTIE